MKYEFVELIDSLVKVEDQVRGAPPSTLVITKSGQYLRGHIVDHNVRINSDGRVRGRIVLFTNDQKKNVDSNDISSLEKI